MNSWPLKSEESFSFQTWHTMWLVIWIFILSIISRPLSINYHFPYIFSASILALSSWVYFGGTPVPIFFVWLTLNLRLKKCVTESKKFLQTLFFPLNSLPHSMGWQTSEVIA